MRRVALLLVCLTIGQAVAQYGLRGRVEVPVLEYAPGQVVVMFREDVAPMQRAWLRQTAGAQLVERGRYADYELWQFSPYADMRQVAAQLMRTGWFIAAEPNWRLELADGWVPNDPLYNQQPALPVIGAPQAWALWRGDDRFIMGIIDTGVRVDHQDLQPRLLAGYDFGNDDNDPSDPFGHGTFVSGIAGAVTNNALGVAAVAPHGKILPVKVFTDARQGYLNDLIDGVNYAVAQGAHAINLSLGTTTAMGTFETVLNNAWNAGVVIVAAAGNNNNTNPFYPCLLPRLHRGRGMQSGWHEVGPINLWRMGGCRRAERGCLLYNQSLRQQLQPKSRWRNFLRRAVCDGAGGDALCAGRRRTRGSLAGAGASRARTHRDDGDRCAGQLCRARDD
jgi:subtilisin family serine protease